MTTPFSLTSAAYVGADPGTVQPWRTDYPGLWLGRPEYPTGLIQLPPSMPDGYTAPANRGKVVHGLLDGGTAVTEFESSMRTWTLTWPRLAARNWSIIDAFDRHLFGTDPLIFVNPEDVNDLTLRESMCGGLSPNDPSLRGWVSNGGTPVYLSGVAPAIYPSGVMQWAPGAAGRILHNGKTYGVVDTDHAAPYIPAAAVCASFYVRTTTGTTSIQARVSGRDPSSNVVAEVTGAATTVGTTWTLVQASAAAGALGTSDYVLAELVSSSSTTVYISNPQLENNAAPSTWAAGAGTPRVLITSSLNRTPDVHWNSAATLTLTECVTGAA